MVGFFERRRILKNTNALDLIPIRVHKHQIEENGNVTILIPKFKSKKLTYFLIPERKAKNVSIHLDELGSAVWLSIDGKKNANSICKELTDKLGEKIFPADERVVKFLSGLFHNRYITFQQIEKE